MMEANKPLTVRAIMKNGSSLMFFSVIQFRLPRGEDYWIVEKSNGRNVFINANEVAVIGFAEDME